jgi:hypothetical protein
MSSISARRSAPAGEPRRDESTAMSCSTSTRVIRPAISTSGRSHDDAAAVDVGAMITVERAASSSAWSTTPNREPRCSWPRPPRGALSRYTSPRFTQRLHELQDRSCLGAIGGVRCEPFGFRAQIGGSLTYRRPDQSISNSLGSRLAALHQQVERTRCLIIESQGDHLSRHRSSVCITNVIQTRHESTIVTERAGRLPVAEWNEQPPDPVE